jgi:hypothetical protein
VSSSKTLYGFYFQKHRSEIHSSSAQNEDNFAKTARPVCPSFGSIDIFEFAESAFLFAHVSQRRSSATIGCGRRSLGGTGLRNLRSSIGDMKNDFEEPSFSTPQRGAQGSPEDQCVRAISERSNSSAGFSAFGAAPSEK